MARLFFEQEFPHRAYGVYVRRDQHVVERLGRLLVDRDTVDRVDQGTKQGVAAEHEQRDILRRGLRSLYWVRQRCGAR